MRLAKLAARANSLHCGDTYRIKDVAETVKGWEKATVLKSAKLCLHVPNIKGNSFDVRPPVPAYYVRTW